MRLGGKVKRKIFWILSAAMGLSLVLASCGPVTEEEGKTVDHSIQIDTATFDFGGILIKTGDDILMYFCTSIPEWGAEPMGTGPLMQHIYHISTDTWDAPIELISPTANHGEWNLGGGVIGSHIYVFYNDIYDHAATWSGYMRSTDLTGTSWESPVELEFPVPAPEPAGAGWYGHIVKTDSPGTFLMPWYGSESYPDDCKIGLFRTTDSGEHWSLWSYIYDGATLWSETCVEYIGDGKMIALSRKDSDGHVGQSTSSDNGETWSAIANTNLGNVGGEKIPWIIYDSERDRVIAFFMDRATGNEGVRISDSDAATVFASPTGWEADTLVHQWGGPHPDYMGYPSIIKVDTRKYFFVYAVYVSATDCDTWGGYYQAVGAVGHIGVPARDSSGGFEALCK